MHTDTTSFNDKITTAFSISSKIADLIDSGVIDQDAMEDGLDDLVYGHADGLIAKRLYNIRDGLCSLACSLAFDPEKEESALDNQIAVMNAVLHASL